MPNGKPAGVRCVQLADDLRCRIFGQPERPACCSGLQASAEMCGSAPIQALAWLAALELATAPDQHPAPATQRTLLNGRSTFSVSLMADVQSAPAATEKSGRGDELQIGQDETPDCEVGRQSQNGRPDGCAW
jgi:hypothetical protein